MVTLDKHLGRVVDQAREALRAEIPGLRLTLHAAADWENNPAALEQCKQDIASANIVVATMLFMEDHIRAIAPALEARQEDCDALVVAMSSGDVIKYTKLGGLRFDKAQKGPLALLKRLKGNKSSNTSSGEGQLAMLRRLPKILRLIPGKAQDLRAYFLTLQYWLSGSEDNLSNLVRFLVGRYSAGPRASYKKLTAAAPPKEYPQVGLYHPNLPDRIAENADALAAAPSANGTVGVLLLRSYVLAGDTAHYDGVIEALEAKGLNVVPVFAAGLDGRPAIERFFKKDGAVTVDAILSLTGFSLVGGPAYNDASAAEETLADLDVPYFSAQAVEFQSLENWARSSNGLTPVEATIMVAIPELDGAIAPMVYGGRSDGSADGGKEGDRRDAGSKATQMRACSERADALAARVCRMIELRRTARHDKKVAIVLFDFPPNAGAAGSAAYLSVFSSLHNTLRALKNGGYTVDVPDSVEALRDVVLKGNSEVFGTDANVSAQIPVDRHVLRERHLDEIEQQWGPAPGRQLTDGRSLFIQGAQFGNVFVGLQPAFGYEGDPMRLLFERGFAPTHAFAAFYSYLREDFGAHAVLHFGTHGALEFMPGKQVGLSGECWPDRLIADTPNLYLYAANNPSEGSIAKRRSGATLISYLTPPVTQAGLYKGLADLKDTINAWRALAPEEAARKKTLLETICEQAKALELDLPEAEDGGPDALVASLTKQLYAYEQTLIPHGLHVVGTPPDLAERMGMLAAMAEDRFGQQVPGPAIEALANGAESAQILELGGLDKTPDTVDALETLRAAAKHLEHDDEIPSVLHALDGGYVRPGPGSDVLRNPEVLPTGRNLHGFDPFRLPSPFAIKEGVDQAQLLLDRHVSESGAIPETVAMILWGTDNLKSGGIPISQALALMGAKPRFDSYGRLCGAELVALKELGRPRIDVVTTLSGIFRDLLPLQTKMLAEAAYLAATADEPEDMNFVRKHALRSQQDLGCDFDTASLRVFSNADGAYGGNVNHLIDSSCWNEEDELADAFQSRKCFAYGRKGTPQREAELFKNVLQTVDMAYQNLESLELGVTTVDHYVDSLGGVSRAVRQARGESVAVYVGDQTQGKAKVRTLTEQVELETRTRTLNPRWYEGLLNHGYEGVRHIECQVTNTMGWSATTGKVDPWVYQKISETFVLDEDMRRRLANLNPKASARMANRLIEAHERHYWTPDPETLDALTRAGNELEDRLEGLSVAAE